MNILQLDKKTILQLQPDDIDRLLSAEEIVYMAKALDAFWAYDYVAAENGQAGKHALLKSGLHSDGFFISRIFLASPNMLEIIAHQLVMHYENLGIQKPDWLVGIPDGATTLGAKVATIMGVKLAEMQKVDGRIMLTSDIPSGDSLLLVEDFCTQATGFTEAVLDITQYNPLIDIFRYELLIINRGGLKQIIVPEVGIFKIIAAAEYRINDWDENACPLCWTYGSDPIKPKESDENWDKINSSQK